MYEEKQGEVVGIEDGVDIDKKKKESTEHEGFFIAEHKAIPIL
jgi:hypothetical protein